MGYVPGIINDVFISYSHHDDASGWVTRFHDEFATQLEELLGCVSIWRDPRLPINEDFPQSIQDALSSTGVLVALVSPNFLRSKYCCELEVPHFEKNVGQPGLKIGNRYRIVKVVPRPAANTRHELWMPNALGVNFWKNDTGRNSVQEFRAGTKHFKDAVARVAQAVAQTLTDLRNARLPIYIAKPSSDLDKVFEGLRKELHARGYRILPGDRIWTEQAISDELAIAALSVHLLGAQPDPFVSRQAEIARGLQIPILAWLNGDARTIYSKLIQELESYPDLKALVEKIPEFKLPALIEQYVQSKAAQDAEPQHTKCRVFILCESREEKEWQFASALKEEISKAVTCDVDVPDPSATNVWQDREQKLRRADGVVVYWDTTDERWLTYAHEDLREMALRRKRDDLPEAIVVGRPKRTLPVDTQLVVDREDPFDIEKLQPFFARLRPGLASQVAS
jgi:hypothetical protein